MPMRLKDTATKLLGALALAVSLVFVLAVTAKAEDHKGWQGCYVGGFGAAVHGAADLGGGFDLGAKGQMLGGTLGCDVLIGPRFVAGGFTEYGRMFGDLHKNIGVDNDWTVGARAGLLINSSTLLYGHGDWSRIDTSGPHFDGWKAGAGVEMKLPAYPQWSLDLRYSHGWYDNVASSGVNVTSDSVRLGLTWKFGAATPVSLFTSEDNTKATPLPKNAPLK